MSTQSSGHATQPDLFSASMKYAEIRSANDIQVIARNSNLPENVIASVKTHLFETVHHIPYGGPNNWIVSRFTPCNDIADLWKAAAQGKRIDEFRRLVGHEYLEHILMKHHKLPYRSPHPHAWMNPSDWTNRPSLQHYGAHDLSPNPWTGDLNGFQLNLWDNFLHR